MKGTRLKILFDTNIIIDALTNRTGSEDSIQCLELMIKNCFLGFLTTKQITDIYYVLRKYLPKEERISSIKKLVSLFCLLDFPKECLFAAIEMDGSDFEDNVISSIAFKSSIDYVLTKDKEGFICIDNWITPSNLIKKCENIQIVNKENVEKMLNGRVIKR